MSVGAILSGAVRPLSVAVKYAWAVKVAVKIAWKFYKYRKDGYSKEELIDIAGVFLSEIGVRLDKSKANGVSESKAVNFKLDGADQLESMPKPKLTVRQILDIKTNNKKGMG